MRLALASVCALTLMSGAAWAAGRIPELDPAQMSPEQKALYDSAVKELGHKPLGPNETWLRTPELAARLKKVSEAILTDTVFPAKYRELAILIVGAEWKATYEWQAHYPRALKEGISPALAGDIKDNRRPAAMSADEALVYNFSTELLRTKRVHDATYDAAVKRFGERGVAELTAVLGMYDLVSMTLNMVEGAAQPQ